MRDDGGGCTYSRVLIVVHAVLVDLASQQSWDGVRRVQGGGGMLPPPYVLRLLLER